MKYSIAQRIFLMLTGLWLGVVLGVGYLVAPTIFASMTDKQAVGMVAGEVFRNTAIFTILLLVFLFILANRFVRSGIETYRSIRWLLLLILILALLGVLVIQPWMNELKDTALAQGAPVMLSEHAKKFSRLHGVSSLMFMLEAVFGLIVFWKLTKFPKEKGLLID